MLTGQGLAVQNLNETSAGADSTQKMPASDGAPRWHGLQEPAPCDACETRNICATGQACPDFSTFVLRGKLVNNDRGASRSLYRRVFSDEGQMAAWVLAMAANGASYRSIAGRLNIGKDAVMAIVKRSRRQE